MTVTFTVDKNGFVVEMAYPSYDVSLVLESKDSNRTIKNKKYLKEYQNSHDIKLIKE